MIQKILGILSMILNLLPFFSKFTDRKFFSCYVIIKHPSAGSRVIIFRLITMAVFVQKCEKSSEIQRRSFYFLWVKAKFFFLMVY